MSYNGRFGNSYAKFFRRVHCSCKPIINFSNAAVQVGTKNQRFGRPAVFGVDLIQILTLLLTRVMRTLFSRRLVDPFADDGSFFDVCNDTIPLQARFVAVNPHECTTMVGVLYL